ncbi:MAG TPA: N-acetylmuramoyl-L-alanine amidase, partial [Ureibacillus sp.]|nr:N-acetylmuramoyl-L-alanine amidase [Ureibacillus sp.]
KGDKITTYAISGGWAQITAGSVKGYVSTAYITKNAASVKKIIVLDPGHGGKDPGAVANGLREKDIVLSVGLYLRDYLKAAGVEVIMTRTSDVYLTLDERVAIAKNSGADSFVSLHMNAAASTSASGTETYSSTAGDSNRVNSSAKLSQFIQERLVDELGTRDRGEKNADYVVIYKNPLPSVLAEMGFLTNAAEAKYVNAHKKKTARAIYLGIMDYYKWAGK